MYHWRLPCSNVNTEDLAECTSSLTPNTLVATLSLLTVRKLGQCKLIMPTGENEGTAYTGTTMWASYREKWTLLQDMVN